MRCVACALLAVACLGGSESVAHADPGSGQPGFAELYRDPGLVPTLGEERARWIVATSGELARTLRAMHGVVDARVHVALPSARVMLDAPPSAASASVLVTRRRGLPPIDEQAVRALVSGAIDGLAPPRIAIVQDEVAAPREPRLVTLGPLRIAAGSVGAFKLVLGAALVLNAALAIALAAAVARRRRAASVA